MKKAFFVILAFLISMQIFAQKHPLTIENLWQMKRVGNVDLSNDNEILAFTVTTFNMEKNKGKTEIWLINTDGSNLKKFGEFEKSVSQPKFIPNSNKLSYISEGQLWSAEIDGSNQQRLTDVYSGVGEVVWAKDGTKFLFTSSVYPDCETQDCNKAKDEELKNRIPTGEIFTELMYRHWDSWRGPKRSHLFFYNLKSNEFIDLTNKSIYDVPPIALGSANDYSISPDGNEVAFTMNTSDFLASSTDNDVFTLNLIDKNTKPKKISTSKGNDNQPVYSPDGKYIAFCSMQREGFEADKQSIVVYNRTTGELINKTADLNISAGQIVWSPCSKYVYYTANNKVYNSIYRINIETLNNDLVLEYGDNSNLIINNDGDKFYFILQKSNLPNEIFKYELDIRTPKQITFMNKDLLSEIEMNDIETFWCDGAEGAKVQSILVKPPFFEKGKKYPMIFLIHGGPQGHWSDDFHYRWNLQLFASRGYVVVAPNPRGSTGYGQKFCDEISKDWGGKVYVDLMSAYDYAVNNFDYIDKNNTFAAGASYGGYMINWIEGHTDRFNALVSHNGSFNLESMYGTTEELWFPEWEFGGPYWDSSEIYEKFSPHKFVKNFKTPMLIVHSAFDFRLSESQAFELFTALQKMGVKSKFLYFPDETHFVTKPQNAKMWWNTIFDWFEENRK
ncbi:MAG: S9 family peptidase [Ignavibacteriales bacterium]|nr:S9 family peptidase [Ignavibacteriales bacterium]